MREKTDYQLILLLLHNLPRIRWKKLSKTLEALYEKKVSPWEFFENEKELTKYWESNGLILEKVNHYSKILTEKGIKLLDLLDPNYPEELKNFPFREGPPPLLYLKGNTGNFKIPKKVAIISSREVSPIGEKIYREVLEKLPKTKEIAIVSSPYRHTYRMVTDYFLSLKENPLILVSCRGLLQTKRKIMENHWEGLLILSPFALEDVGTPSSIQRRDKVIISLSSTIIAIEVREGGNMFEFLKIALKTGKKVYVYKPPFSTTTSSGNTSLIENGAIPFRDFSEDIVNL